MTYFILCLGYENEHKSEPTVNEIVVQAARLLGRGERNQNLRITVAAAGQNMYLRITTLTTSLTSFKNHFLESSFKNQAMLKTQSL